jgi:hypothetical protein
VGVIDVEMYPVHGIYTFYRGKRIASFQFLILRSMAIVIYYQRRAIDEVEPSAILFSR